MAEVERCGSERPFTDEKHLRAATEKGSPRYQAIEVLLKGPEINLVKHGQPEYLDKDNNPRDAARLRWWDDEARTLAEIAVMTGDATTADGAPYPALPDLQLPADQRLYRYTDQVPLFYGHYWRRGEPTPRRDWTATTACVDFSAVKGGTLSAYCWSGETQIDPEHYVHVGAGGGSSAVSSGPGRIRSH